MNRPTTVTNRIRETSSSFNNVRVVDVFYLLNLLAAILAVLLLDRLIVSGDAGGGSAILAHEPAYRLGCAAGLIATSCYVTLSALLYSLLKPVSRTISLLSAFLSLLGCAIGVLDTLSHLAPLIVLKSGGYLGMFRITVHLLTGDDYFRAFDATQLAALAQFFTNFEGSSLEIGFLFLGLGSTVFACLCSQPLSEGGPALNRNYDGSLPEAARGGSRRVSERPRPLQSREQTNL